MKLLQVLNVLPEYEKVTITPDCNLEWNADNPYSLDPQKVSDLGWLFVRAISDRDVTCIQSQARGNDDLAVIYISISYK